MNQNTVYNFTIDAEHAGLRADGVLSQLFEEASRSYIQKLIESGCVFCDGKPMLSKKEKLKEGSEVRIELPPAVPCEAVPQDIPLDIVYEDAHLVVVNKPKGMVVHPAPGNPDGTLVNGLLHHCGALSLINGVAFIVYTNNFEWFGNNPRKIATYWGVAVFGKESGTSVKGKTKTSKCASRKLKKLISEAATCAIRWDPRIKAYYQKMRNKGKHHGVAMNNVKNKLIHIITALAVNKTKYGDTYEEDRKLRKAG